MATILVDQDGVLADFEYKFYQVWCEKGPCEAIHPDLRKKFYVQHDYPEQYFDFGMRIMSEPGFFLDMSPIEGSAKALREMVSLGHNVHICTKPLDDYRYCVPEKCAWVEKHLGLDFVEKMIFTKDKTMVRGDFLIDDNPNITGSLIPEWQHIAFSAPYNKQCESPRLVNWMDWPAILQVHHPSYT